MQKMFAKLNIIRDDIKPELKPLKNDIHEIKEDIKKIKDVGDLKRASLELSDEHKKRKHDVEGSLTGKPIDISK
ncbi:MAG: hypothetical protein MI740_11135 [Halanaerobiales bacterium]|nr:hypothetical protein [Halanaerobiales bacterium]